jgi:prepilin-type processing-associated H-X9-DG protein
LLDNTGYKKVAAGLPKNLVALTYVDSQAQFNQMMMGIQQFWPLAVMAATNAGITLPVMLPKLDAVARQMQPGCRYAYFDAEGLHSRYQGSGVEAAIGGIAGGAVGMAVALPAVARARDQARRAASMSHLKQIGLALIMSADAHEGRLPQGLDELRAYKIDSTVLQSPRKPKAFNGPSYIYIAGETAVMSPQNILAYENPEFCTDGTSVLYMDGHVAFVKPQQFREQLAETYKRLGRETPQIRFKGETK